MSGFGLAVAFERTRPHSSIFSQAKAPCATSTDQQFAAPGGAGFSLPGPLTRAVRTPKEDAIKYENAPTAGKFLVIARGTPEEAERAPHRR